MSATRRNVAGEMSRIASLFEATDPKIAAILKGKRKQGLQEMKDQTHPQMWRVDAITGTRKKVVGYGNLGPMGALGDDAIFYLRMTPELKIMIDNGYLSKSKILNIIKSEIYNPIKKLLTAHIWTWVPGDSHDLRKAMTKSLTMSGGSITNDIPFLLQLNTRGVDYAKVVMNMPLHYIKHGGAGDVHALLGRRTKSRKKKSDGSPNPNAGQKLSDPKVKENSYNWVLLVGRKEARKRWKLARKKIFKILKLSPMSLLGGRKINTLMSKAFIPAFNNKF